MLSDWYKLLILWKLQIKRNEEQKNERTKATTRATWKVHFEAKSMWYNERAAAAGIRFDDEKKKRRRRNKLLCDQTQLIQTKLNEPFSWYFNFFFLPLDYYGDSCMGNLFVAIFFFISFHSSRHFIRSVCFQHNIHFRRSRLDLFRFFSLLDKKPKYLSSKCRQFGAVLIFILEWRIMDGEFERYNRSGLAAMKKKKKNLRWVSRHKVPEHNKNAQLFEYHHYGKWCECVICMCRNKDIIAIAQTHRHKVRRNEMGMDRRVRWK